MAEVVVQIVVGLSNQAAPPPQWMRHLSPAVALLVEAAPAASEEEEIRRG